MKKAILVLFLALCLFPGRVVASEPWLVDVSGKPFIDIRSFSETKGLRYQWDAVAHNASVHRPDGVLRFHVGSRYFLDGDSVRELDESCRFYSGRVVISASAKSFLESSFPSRQPYVVPAESVPGTHRIRKVVVDAGHGGRDTGAVNSHGVREKDIVLDIAQKVRDGLRAHGIDVVMTRQSDIFIPLRERARIANKKGADFFVSIHANAAESRSLSGFEVYHLSEAIDDQALAVERAENLPIGFRSETAMAADRDLQVIFWDLAEAENRKESVKMSGRITEAVGRSVEVSAKRELTANFYVLKWTECPAVLIETGYLTNDEDESRLRSPEYQEALAGAIVRGLVAYKKDFEDSDGFTRQR